MWKLRSLYRESGTTERKMVDHGLVGRKEEEGVKGEGSEMRGKGDRKGE